MKKFFLSIVLVAILLSLFSITVFADEYFILNTESGIYHRTSCSYLPSPGNRKQLAAEEIEYYDNIFPCKHCKASKYISSLKDSGSDTTVFKNNSGKSNVLLDVLKGFLNVIVGAIAFIIMCISGCQAFDLLPDFTRENQYQDFSTKLGACCFVFLALSSFLVFVVVFNQGILAIVDDYFKWLFVPFYITLPSTVLWCFITKHKLF